MSHPTHIFQKNRLPKRNVARFSSSFLDLNPSFSKVCLSSDGFALSFPAPDNLYLAYQARNRMDLIFLSRRSITHLLMSSKRGTMYLAFLSRHSTTKQSSNSVLILLASSSLSRCPAISRFLCGYASRLYFPTLNNQQWSTALRRQLCFFVLSLRSTTNALRSRYIFRLYFSSLFQLPATLP